MKDAPRDGTRILLGRASRAVKRSVCIGRAVDDAGYGKTWALETSTYHRETEFMGWMPLPSIFLADTWPQFVAAPAQESAA